MIDVVTISTKLELIEISLVQRAPLLVKCLRMPDFIDAVVRNISHAVLGLGIKTAHCYTAIGQDGDVMIKALTKVDLVTSSAVVL